MSDDPVQAEDIKAGLNAISESIKAHTDLPFRVIVVVAVIDGEVPSTYSGALINLPDEQALVGYMLHMTLEKMMGRGYAIIESSQVIQQEPPVRVQ